VAGVFVAEIFFTSTNKTVDSQEYPDIGDKLGSSQTRIAIWARTLREIQHHDCGVRGSAPQVASRTLKCDAIE